MSPPCRWAVAVAVFLISGFFSVAVEAQNIVNSTFVGPPFSAYSEPGNWLPALVPNNSAETSYNVMVSAPDGVEVDINATISNLAVGGGDGQAIGLNGRNLTVTGTTEILTPELQPVIYLGGYGRSAILDAGTLANFDAASRTLRGGSFTLSGGEPVDATVVELRFMGAEIVNNAGSLELQGVSPRITDRNGLDALRNFANNMPAGAFKLLRRPFVTSGDFTQKGLLELAESTFLVTGSLTNYDPVSHTLRDGTFDLFKSVLRFRGADIVHNAASLTVDQPGSVQDEFGRDGLRNFRDNLESGVFILPAVGMFTAPGSFSNAGRIETIEPGISGFGNVPREDGFRVPAGGAFTQTAGATINNGKLVAGRIEIQGGIAQGHGNVEGNVVVGSGTIYSDFAVSIQGSLTLSADARLRLVAQRPYRGNFQPSNSGPNILAGRLEIEVPPGVAGFPD